MVDPVRVNNARSQSKFNPENENPNQTNVFTETADPNLIL